jgi:hypothetical protein
MNGFKLDMFSGLGRGMLNEACRLAFNDPACRTECNVFVHRVAERLGLPLKAGDADTIYREIHNPPWLKIDEGPASAWIAAKRAEEGSLVIAACPHEKILDAKTGQVRGDTHGHVCVVTGVGYVRAGTRVSAAQGMHNKPGAAFFGRSLTNAFNVKTIKNVYSAHRRIPGLDLLDPPVVGPLRME